nr:chloride intracellular channel protein 3 isoform X2 [Microcebus murinus]
MAETTKLQLFVKVLAGERGWGERGALPLLPAALHGPAPQGRALHTHHGGHAQVRPHPGAPPWPPHAGGPAPSFPAGAHRSPDVLKDFAPGSQLPILLCDGDAKTDTLQIEEFLEETLGPPDFPSLAPRYRESNTAGNDIFHKFSAFIKNPVPAQDDALYQQLLRALARLDSYLLAPLEHELEREPRLRESRRRFLDGDQLSLADCRLLPKLHIVDAPIPAELRGVRRYLDCAMREKEFKYTCPHSSEILAAYRPAVRPRPAPASAAP